MTYSVFSGTLNPTHCTVTHPMNMSFNAKSLTAVLLGNSLILRHVYGVKFTKDPLWRNE